MKKSFIFLAAALAFSACSTTAFVNVDDRTQYDIVPLVTKSLVLDEKHNIACGSYALVTSERTERDTGGWSIGTSEDDVDFGKSHDYEDRFYSFTKDGTQLHTVALYSAKNGMRFGKVTSYSQTVSFTIDDGAPLLLSDQETVINLTRPLAISMEKIHESYQNGKVYKMWFNMATGLRVFVGNEEYAVLDGLSEYAVMYNKRFSARLTPEELDYVHLIILVAFEYWKTYYNQHETTSDGLIFH